MSNAIAISSNNSFSPPDFGDLGGIRRGLPRRPISMVSFPRKDISGIILKASAGNGCACAGDGPSSFYESGYAIQDSTEGGFAEDIAAFCSIAAGIVLSACGSGGAGGRFIFYGCAKFVLSR